MNLNRLYEIATRLRASTPGPWASTYHNRTETWTVTSPSKGGENDTCNDTEFIVVQAKTGSCSDELDNVNFIANSPTDTKDLLAVVKVQREALEELHDHNDSGVTYGNCVACKALEACDQILGNE